MDLHKTATYMVSGDYKKRFIAEYWQTKIRYEKLKAFNNKIEAAMILKSDSIIPVEEPKHYCPLHLLQEQQAAMGKYLKMLELRAVIEKIELNEVL